MSQVSLKCGKCKVSLKTTNPLTLRIRLLKGKKKKEGKKGKKKKSNSIPSTLERIRSVIPVCSPKKHTF